MLKRRGKGMRGKERETEDRIYRALQWKVIIYCKKTRDVKVKTAYLHFITIFSIHGQLFLFRGPEVMYLDRSTTKRTGEKQSSREFRFRE